MEEKLISQIKSKINRIKNEILKLEEMRPGSITKQYRNPKEKVGPFYQLSYTHKMKSRTEYVRPQFVKEVRGQIRNFKKFKKLIEEWIDLSIELAKLQMQIKKEKSDKN